jgi:hypothetical protein
MEALPISIFSIESKPYGITYGEWSAKWWQWLLSIPKPDNPAFDSTGINANVNQNDPNVFFLCQTYEGVKSIPNRSVKVPAGRSIFMPVINWVSILHDDGETDQELLAIAKQRMDVVANLEITVNGITINEGLEKYRAQSPFFDVALPEGNIVDSSPGSRRCVADGYWVFLESLDTVRAISSFGSCSSGVTKIGVNYEITTK